MRRILLTVMALGMMIACAGCASALNLQNDSLRKPYGGVTMSLFDFSGGGEAAEYAGLFLSPYWLIDKPLSFLADTLTLPYTLWAKQNPPSSPNTYPPKLSQPAP